LARKMTRKGRRWGKGRRRWGTRKWATKRRRGVGSKRIRAMIRSRRWSKKAGKRNYGREWLKKRFSRKNLRFQAYRPNLSSNFGSDFSFSPNNPYSSTKELVLAGLCAIAGYAVPQLVSGALSKFVHPAAGAAGAIVTGAATVYLSKKIDNDSYAKGTAIGGILGILAGAAVSAAMIYQQFKPKGSDPKATAGFGLAHFNQAARYVPMGQFQQAAAGQFQQAAAGQFQQAAAGEYIQGTGEYFSADNSLAPVSDFGEYVSNGLNVQGYADYEVVPHHGGMDGFVSDGVYPNGNLNDEFAIMEAAAGFGNAPAHSSDYVPTVGSRPIGSQAAPDDQGIFDIGGSNGVFG
jgi:hypothetical protein